MIDPYLDQLTALADPERAAGMAAYHKVERRYLGLSNPQVTGLVKGWRQALTVDERAALVITLPWTKQNNPKPADLEIRDRVLGWAAGYVPDRQWFIQKAIAWWLRELSKHDAPRVRAFLDQHGAAMKPFARKEAGKYLG